MARRGRAELTAHADLVRRAYRWLVNTRGCSVAFTEFGTGSWEHPDVIGFQAWTSVLVECKVSRADFFADWKKPFRIRPHTGMGMQRYYMVPAGLVAVGELPEKWGLLEVKGRHVRITRNAEGFASRNRSAEITFLVSMLRRAQLRISEPLTDWLRLSKPTENLENRPENAH